MKLIKNTFFALIIPAMIFGCEPLDEVYQELEEIEDEVGADANVSISYTLIADDYATLASTLEAKGTVQDSMKADFITQNEAFHAGIAVSDLLADFVNDNYPQLRKGAAVKVTYKTLEGDSFVDGSAEYVNASNYTLDGDDYASVSTQAGSFGFFDSNIDAEAEVATILQTSAQGAEAGDIWSASYQYFSESYADLSGETVFNEPFETTLNNFETVNVLGEQEWGWGTFGGDTYARMSGFSGGAVPNEDWLVSPAIDLSSESGDITLLFTQILNFQGASEWGVDLDVKFTTNYTGDVSTTDWVSLGEDLSAYPDGDNYDLYDSEVALSGAAGNTIHIAYTYKSTDSYAALWEIVNVRVDVGAAPETDLVNVFYEYDGSEWSSISDEAYYLGSADYDAMGAPGRFDNFSSSTPPEDYIPSFLRNRYPFAQEGDEYVVVYRFFAGSTFTRGDVYEFTSGAWSPISIEDQLVTKTDQYVNTGTGFTFNPSVVLTMGSSDFQLIVDEVAQTRPELVNSFGTGEDYYGADAFFVNFDIRLTSRLETDDNGDPLQPEYIGLPESEALALIQTRVIEGIDVFLESRFSDAQPIDGIEILYTVSYATFDGSNAQGTAVFTLTGVGSFEYNGGE